MPDTRSDIILHFVWGTKGRQPSMDCTRRQELFHCMLAEVQALGCEALAVGGTDDHVHLLVSLRTDVAASRLAQQVKGVASQFAKDQLGWSGFYWQDGYGVFSVSRSHLPRVAAYIANQEAHHAGGRLWPACEPGVDTPG